MAEVVVVAAPEERRQEELEQISTESWEGLVQQQALRGRLEASYPAFQY